MRKIAQLFSRDPVSAIDRTASQLSTVDGEISALQAERQRALLELESADDVAAIDAKLEHKGRTAKIHRDRLTALRGLQRQQATERRQEQKAAALVSLKKHLEARVVVAGRIDAALQELSASLAAYDEVRRQTFQGWPSVFPRLQDYMTHHDAVDIVARLLHWPMQHRSSLFRLPNQLRDANLDPELLAAREQRNSEWLLRDIEEEPLPALPEAEEAA